VIEFSIKNITRYAKKVNKKVVAYQAIVGYIHQHKKTDFTSLMRKEELILTWLY